MQERNVACSDVAHGTNRLTGGCVYATGSEATSDRGHPCIKNIKARGHRRCNLVSVHYEKTVAITCHGTRKFVSRQRSLIYVKEGKMS